MVLYTNRSAKHRYGKQRCQISDRTHFHMENMSLQIRNMFDTKPTSAELTSSRKPFAKRPFHQWNTQSYKPTPWKRVALGTRTPNDTHPRSKRTGPQQSGDNSPEHGGMPKSKKIANRKNRKPPSFWAGNGPTALKHRPRARTKPRPQRRLLTSALYLKNHHVPKLPERSTCAL